MSETGEDEPLSSQMDEQPPRLPWIVPSFPAGLEHSASLRQPPPVPSLAQPRVNAFQFGPHVPAQRENIGRPLQIAAQKGAMETQWLHHSIDASRSANTTSQHLDAEEEIEFDDYSDNPRPLNNARLVEPGSGSFSPPTLYNAPVYSHKDTPLHTYQSQSLSRSDAWTAGPRHTVDHEMLARVQSHAQKRRLLELGDQPALKKPRNGQKQIPQTNFTYRSRRQRPGSNARRRAQQKYAETEANAAASIDPTDELAVVVELADGFERPVPTSSDNSTSHGAEDQSVHPSSSYASASSSSAPSPVWEPWRYL